MREMAESLKNNTAADKRQQIAKLVKTQLDLEEQVARHEEKLKEAKTLLDVFASTTFPDYLLQEGIDEITLFDGTKVKRQQVIAAKVTQANAPVAFKWLRDNDHGDMIKEALIVSEKEAMDEARRYMENLRIPFDTKETIHPQTLKAWVREMLEKGAKFPLKTFSVFVGNKSVVTEPS